MNKIEIFKRYFHSLMKKADYKKAAEFHNFLYSYFARKGQLTEYVYCITDLQLHQITDEILLEFC